METNPISLDAHRIAVTGARALISEERWQALLGLLIDAEVVSPAEVAGMCERLADRLEKHADGIGPCNMVRHPGELRYAAARAKNVARLCRAG